jgi:hypothetical protein
MRVLSILRLAARNIFRDSLNVTIYARKKISCNGEGSDVGRVRDHIRNFLFVLLKFVWFLVKKCYI